MKVVLVGPELEENLALRYLCSAMYKAHHECEIVPFNRRSDVGSAARAILRQRPALVGLSLVAQCRYGDIRELVATLRRAGYAGHVTAGGHFAGLRAPEVLRDTPGLDTILHHDGEERLVSLAQLLDSARGRDDGKPNVHYAGFPRRLPAGFPADLDGVSWRNADGVIRHIPAVRVANLDTLPFPSRRRPDRILGYARAPIVSSRGCAGSCSFCSIHAWHQQVPSGRLRFRSPIDVAEEMVALRREHGVRVFIFHDDDFIHPDRRKALPRCREILDRAQRGIGEPFAFVIKCRPDDVDADLFRYLKSMGLVRAYVGIETHSAAGIAALNRRVAPATNISALEILRGLGIYACFNLLLFHPDTTIEELEENLDFLGHHLSHPFDIARAELYARSPLEQRMIREGRATGDYRGHGYRIADAHAESVFQLFSEALWDRHFGGNSILHRVQDLGFRLSLLGHLHPEMASTDLSARVDSLIRGVNADTVGYMRRLVAMATTRDEARKAALDLLRRDLRAGLRKQWAGLAAISLEIESRALIGRSGLSAAPSAMRMPQILGRIAATPCVALLLGSLSCSGIWDDQPHVCDPPPPPHQFSRDIEPILNGTCAVTECHSAATAAGGLVFAAGVSRANLVGVPSTELPSMDRVHPDRPDSSYLVHKLAGTQASVGGSGDQMPTGDQPEQELLSRVRMWIGEGAKED